MARKKDREQRFKNPRQKKKAKSSVLHTSRATCRLSTNHIIFIAINAGVEPIAFFGAEGVELLSKNGSSASKADQLKERSILDRHTDTHIVAVGFKVYVNCRGTERDVKMHAWYDTGQASLGNDCKN